MKFLEVKKIWDNSTHNAFTDLVRYGEYWYCIFREASDHISMDGSLRVIRSKKGKKWSSVALFKHKDADIRDGKFSITSNNKLMINSGIRLKQEVNGHKIKSVTWLSSNGKKWSKMQVCKTGLGTWRWSTTWNEGIAYSIGYTQRDKEGCLYSSKDGKKWKIVKNKLFPFINSYWNESSLVFLENGDAYCLLRRDSQNYSSSLGFSKAPYKHWTWSDLGIAIGGPKMIYIKELDKFVAALRLYGNKSARTSLCYIDINKGEVQEVMCLPSGGDTSYAGLVYESDILYISYYSSHEGKSSIYLAKVIL